METTQLHLEIRRKKDILLQVTVQLKAHFIGLDHIIDEVMNLVSAWYIFPQAQLRPTVINLWGMTGSGKTALVEKLIELLDHKKRYVKMDMGEFDSDSSSWFKSTFTDDLAYFDGEPVVLCLDEFQFARTLDANGNEIGKDKLRSLWELIDSGQITYLPYNSTFVMKNSEICLLHLLRAQDAGVKVVNGIVTPESEAAFLEIFKGFYFHQYDRFNEPFSASYFLSKDFITGLAYLYDDDQVRNETLKEELTHADLDRLIELVLKGSRTRVAMKQLDLSKALIFVLGNLDEAYNMSHSLNPDISADELHAATLRINIGNIKSALKQRFRNEQIARLGNNHIIYRAFTNAHFKALIGRELERINRFVQEQFGFGLAFHESVHEVVYREGVYPAQGTRPVLTTVKNLVEAWISKVAIEVVEKEMPVDLVEWSYLDERYVFVFKDQAGGILNLYEEKVLMKMDSLRRIGNRDTQAHVAVHEAGHAILAALTLRILPSVVVSKTAADNCEGFCMINFPEGLTTRHTLKKDIVITLGGFVAEKLIFGEEHTSSGVYGDIENASELANKAVKYYGMGSDPIYIAVQSSDNNAYFFNKEEYTRQALELVKEAQLEAERLLGENKLLLLKMAAFLVDHNRLEEAGIGEMMEQYGKEDWIREEGFVKKENYFAFENSLNRQLEQLAPAQTTC